MEHGKGYLTLMNFLDELERFSEVVLTRKRWRTLYSQQFFHEYGIPDKDFDGLPGAMCRYPKQSPNTDCISKDSVHRARITPQVRFPAGRSPQSGAFACIRGSARWSEWRRG
jgi:hypothetical protein